MLRSISALVAIFCLFVVQSVSAASFAPATVKEQAEQLGLGAKIKLKLATGDRVSGSIEAIRDDGLLISSKGGADPKLIGYEEIRQLKIASRRYTRHDAGDPLAARRVVVALGVGQHIVVNPDGKKAIHGNIQSIDADGFTVMPDRETAPVQIAYADVRHVEKNLSLGGTIVLVVLIVAAVIVITAVR